MKLYFFVKAGGAIGDRAGAARHGKTRHGKTRHDKIET
jgi:hypothetical protein